MKYIWIFLLILLIPESRPPVQRFTNLPIAGVTHRVAGQELTESPLILKSKEFCEIGELIRLDASSSEVDGLTWQILPDTEDFEVVDSRAFLSAREPGSFLVILAACKDNKPYLLHHTVTIEGGPTIVSLESKIKSAYAKVTSPTKKEEALRVAGVFRTLASTDVEVDKILEATAKANREALGEALQTWVPFLEVLGKELDLYIKEDQLGTKEQYQQVWSDIATALEKAAK